MVRLCSGTSFSPPVHHRKKRPFAVSRGRRTAAAVHLASGCLLPQSGRALRMIPGLKSIIQRDETNPSFPQRVIPDHIQHSPEFVCVFAFIPRTMLYFTILKMYVSKYSCKVDCDCMHKIKRGFYSMTASNELFCPPVEDTLDEDWEAKGFLRKTEELCWNCWALRQSVICFVDGNNPDLRIKLQTQWAILDSGKGF